MQPQCFGDDQSSADLMSSWEDEQVSNEAQKCCVGIKLHATSEMCAQFSQIYPVVCVPASYFIGKNGTPLAVIGGSVSPDDLMRKVIEVKQIHNEQTSRACEEVKAVMNQCPSDDAPTNTVSSTGHLGSQDSSATAKGDNSNSVSVTTETGDEASVCSQVEENVDTKLKRPNRKLEERQEEGRRAEEEENERRKLGKDLLNIRRKRQEDSNKCMLEERNREKAEEKAARERVKQQIAMDRAERATRYAKTHKEEKLARQAILQAKQNEDEAEKKAQAKEKSAIARIQFRLPDGSSVTNQFPSNSTLLEAQQFIAQELGNCYGHFSLATMFPRHEFTHEELSQTLVELELCPSASIVVLPSTRPTKSMVQSSGRGVWAILETILYPLLAVWRFISSFLYVSPSPSPKRPRDHLPPSEMYTRSPPASSEKPKRDTRPKYSSEKPTQDFKRDGKIYRFRNQEDSEDDNNTWNGNSTQQM